MSVRASKKRRLRGIFGVIFSLLTIALLAALAFHLISTGKLTSMSWLTQAFSKRVKTLVSSEFEFDVGMHRTFAELGDGFAAAGTLGLQVFDLGGNETIRDAFQMSSPAIRSANGRAVAYDIGGTRLRVFNTWNILMPLETAGPIVSASINKNGWVCVSTQDGGGYKGSVTVYKANGKAVYKFDSASGYVLAAELTPDNKVLAVLTLTDTGSRIVFYNLGSEDPLAYFEHKNSLIIDIRCLPDGRVLAVTKESLILVNKKGEAEVLYDYNGRILRGYAEDAGLIALYLLDYAVGRSGKLVALRTSGEISGELGTDSEIVSLSVKNRRLAVLWDDSISYYDSKLTEFIEPQETLTNSLRHILALDGGIFAAGEYTAFVITN